MLVRFTQQLARFVEAPSVEVEAGSPRQALARAFEANPRLQSYIVDEQGDLRKHVAVFVDGQLLRGSDALDAALRESARIDVMQALSGG